MVITRETRMMAFCGPAFIAIAESGKREIASVPVLRYRSEVAYDRAASALSGLPINVALATVFGIVMTLAEDAEKTPKLVLQAMHQADPGPVTEFLLSLILGVEAGGEPDDRGNSATGPAPAAGDTRAHR